MSWQQATKDRANGKPKARPKQNKPPLDARLTDVGNGELFVRDHGTIVRYCHPWEKWLIYDGTRWRPDDMGNAMRLAKETVLGQFTRAQHQISVLAKDDSQHSKILLARIKAELDHAHRSQNIKRLEAMLRCAQSELGIPILPNKLDRDHWILNVANGTLDLRTGELRQHKSEDHITKLCPVGFDPSAQCPVFLRTIDAIFARNEELIAYVHRFMGYCLTGSINEQLTPIAYGVGSNGKTLLFKTLMEVLGKDYSGTVAPELLLRTHGNQHPTIKVDLHGKRLMVAAETGRKAEINEERLKALTGGDEIKARRCGEDFWGFEPTHKLLLMTNHKPRIGDQDHGIWRRLALWPFTVRFWDGAKGETGPPELEADKELTAKLTKEREGILAWLVRGCMEWQRVGLGAPEIVLAATKEYRSAEDRIGAFIDERCERNAEFRAKATELFATYKAWCSANGETNETKTSFTQTIADQHGINLDAGRRWYIGLKLVAAENDD